jgi:hypothetical protein
MFSVDWSAIFSFQNLISNALWSIGVAGVLHLWKRWGKVGFWNGSSLSYWLFATIVPFVILSAVRVPSGSNFSRSRVDATITGNVHGDSVRNQTASVLIDLVLINTGESGAVDTITAKYITSPGHVIVGTLEPQYLDLTFPLETGGEPITVPASRFIVRRLGAPIPRGGTVTGSILFLFENLNFRDAQTPEAVLEVTITDAFGRSYPIKHKRL